MSGTLHIWTIYDHPRDVPDAFVARRHDITAGRSTPTEDVRLGPTLAAVREQLPLGLVCLGRSADDDPTIVESWV